MAGKKTGYVYDADMLKHENPWDPDHIECPDRLGVSHRRCQELGLLDRCERLPSRRASDEELLLAHSKEYIEKLVRVLFKFLAGLRTNYSGLSFTEGAREQVRRGDKARHTCEVCVHERALFRFCEVGGGSSHRPR